MANSSEQAYLAKLAELGISQMDADTIRKDPQYQMAAKVAWDKMMELKTEEALKMLEKSKARAGGGKRRKSKKRKSKKRKYTKKRKSKRRRTTRS